jgi:dienelactone hydrolase
MGWRPAFLAIAAAIILNGPAQAIDGQHVKFDDPEQGPETLEAVLYRPAGATKPGPAIVALHGCGGSTRSNGRPLSRTTDWTERWLDAGYAVLWPDSYGSRGLGPQCETRKRRVFPHQRARDAQAAARWLASQPGIDAQRIALVGWSNGGSTVLHAVGTGGPAPNPDFRAAIAFYPGCRVPLERALREEGAPWAARLPLTILIGGADDWTPPERCREIGRRAGVRHIEYDGAFHGFDARNSPVGIRRDLAFTADGSGTARQGTDPKARAAAIAEVAAILAGAFK